MSQYKLKNDKASKNNKVYDSCNNNNQNIDVASHLNSDAYVIDNLDQKLLELLIKGYENKKIAIEVKTPLSTIQRRIRKIFENQYINRKNELNYNKLGLRKGFLQISLKDNESHIVAQKLAGFKGITSVSEVIGNFDIICICVFRDSDELFRLIENIKTIERIDKVAWVEEVQSLPIEEEKIAAFGFNV